MKKGIVFLVLLFFLSARGNAQNWYYHYNGEKINLTVDRSCLKVVTHSHFQLPSILSINNKNFGVEMISNEDQLESQKITKLTFASALNETEYSNMVKILKEDPNVIRVSPYFESPLLENNPIGISDIFYVKLKKNGDTTLLKTVAKQKNIRIVKQIPYATEWYILSLNATDKTTSLEVANQFFEMGCFADIDPALMLSVEHTCTNDPEFYRLWNLKNTICPGIDINVCKAWEITRGAGVKIAVFDDGIDRNHNDLRGNLSSLSFDAKSGQSPSVFTSGNTHGTHVAGIVGAIRNNGLQVVGVAPESSIIEISHSFVQSSTILAEFASGINWAWQNGADVINCSWKVIGGRSPLLDNAILNAITQGRNGKGCVVVFASGNDGSGVSYPADSHPDILTVGAVNDNGMLAMSNYGPLLDLVAPCCCYSTMPGNQIGYKSGTSMAAPHVAGIAAIVLSVKPGLTGQEVRDIIEKTAKKLGQFNYEITANRPNGLWNYYTGYGLADAYAAVSAAFLCTGITNFMNQTVNSNTTVTGCNINVENVTVTNGSNALFDATETTTISNNFEVLPGATLEVK